MIIIDGLRIGYIVIWGISIIGFVASTLRFLRNYREKVEKKVGPLPTPISFLNLIALAILVTRIGEIEPNSSIGWLILRILGLGLSFYGLVLLPMTMQTLDRYGIPGAALLEDHKLITSGPYQLVRHPGYSAFLALWLGTALAMLNWIMLVLWPLGITGAYLSSRAEDELLRGEFGRDYEAYAERTYRFIPGVW